MGKVVYICSPCRGNYEKNITKAQGYCREAMLLFPGVVPIAPHVYFTQFLDDSKPRERKAGLEAGLKLLELCDELWVYGIQNPSEGMAAEIARAKELGIPVRDAAEIYTTPLMPATGSAAAEAAAPAAKEARRTWHPTEPAAPITIDTGDIVEAMQRAGLRGIAQIGGDSNGMG